MANMGEQNTQEPFTDVESITSNAELHWDRFNKDDLCFKSQLDVPIKIVDVLSTGLVQNTEASNGTTLKNYIEGER